MVTKAILECSLEGTGALHRTPIFPCGIFTMKKGVNYPGDPNYDLFKLALKSTAKRLYPNYGNGDWSAQKAWIKYDRDRKQEVLNELSDEEYKKLYDIVAENEKIANFLMLTPSMGKLYVNQEEKPGEIFATMGCRTVNGADINAKDSYRRNIHSLINGGGIIDDVYSAAQKDGRGNICPVTIILPTLAMEAKESCKSDYPPDIFNRFMEILDEAIDEAKDQLIDRYNHICSQKPEAAQFMYENHTMAGFIPEKGIKSAIVHGTLAIGNLGLAEALTLIFGFDHTNPIGMEYAKKIYQLYKDRCNEYKEKYSLNFGVYNSPAENLSYTAMKKFQKKYGTIEGVSDKEYFTNSMHVPVYKKMDSFQKIDIESQLTGYSSAGCITYVELESTVKNNLEALETLVLYAMEKDIPYFAINVPNDTCMDCGFCDEINDTCPQCGGEDIQRLRRVTGYLTGDYKSAFNKGKQQEVEMRVKHR